MNVFSQISYNHLLGFVFAGALMCVLITYFIPLAHKQGLVARPVGRKTHSGSIPLIGGIVLAASLSLSLLLFPNSFQDIRFLFFGIGLLTIVGALDDQKEIGPNSRFLAQIVVAVSLVVLDGTIVTYVGSIIGQHSPLGLGIFAIPFSIIAIVGTVNAYNMIDGHDGLAGLCFLISLLGFLALLSFRSTILDQQYIVIVILLIVLIFVFLPFNLGLLGHRRKIFLGDAGSMLCGLVIVFLAIRFSQREVPVLVTSAAAWVVGVPLLDMIAVIIRRLHARTSITASDRKHIHHFLCEIGVPTYLVTIILIFLHSICVSIGVLGTLLEWSEGWLFWSTFGLLGLYLIAVFKLERRSDPKISSDSGKGV